MKALLFDNDITPFRNRKAVVLMVIPFIVFLVFRLQLVPASLGSISMENILPYIFAGMCLLFFVVAIFVQKLLFKLCGFVFKWLPAVFSTVIGFVLVYLQVSFINNDYVYLALFLLFCCVIGADEKYQNPSLVENIAVSFIRFFSFCLFYFNAVFNLNFLILR